MKKIVYGVAKVDLVLEIDDTKYPVSENAFDTFRNVVDAHDFTISTEGVKILNEEIVGFGGVSWDTWEPNEKV